jgi:GntR family transcriptional regulator
MNIVISNTSGIPIYEQIKEQIRTAIVNGEIKEGEILPSIRQLAHDLKISVITTMRAYSDLENEGFVKNVQGKGCYVMPINHDFIREQKLREIEEHFINAIDAAKIIQLSDAELMNILDILIKESK